jgi:general stress protein YciG
MCRSCHRKLDHKKSPVLQEAWKKARAELTVEIQRAGGRNAPHPGKKFTHEEAVEMGRKGGLAKAENRKNKKG